MELMWTRGKWRVEKMITKMERTNPLMPFLYALNALGRLPFVRKKSGEIEFKLISLPMLWAVTIMTIQAVIVVVVFRWRVTHEESWASFNKSLNSLKVLSFVSTTFHGPIFTWMSTSSILEAVNNWSAFCVSFQKIVKKPITSGLLRYSYLSMMTVLLPLFQITVVDSFSEKISLFNIVKNAILTMCVAYEIIIVLSWIVFCLAVKTAADLLKESLMELMWTRGKWRVEKMITKMERTNPLMPFLYALNALGRLPFVRKKSGEIEFKLISLPMLWAVTIMTIQAVIVVVVFRWRVTHEEYWASFNKSLNSLKVLSFVSTTFHGPIFTWMSTSSILEAVNNWSAFCVSFQKIVKKPITSGLLRYSYLSMMTVLLPLFQITVVDSFSEKISLFNIVKNAILTMCVAYEIIIVLSWIVFCLAVKTAADLLKESLMEMVTNVPSPYLLFTYRLLWIELHECTTRLTHAFDKTLKAFLFTFIINEILNIYIFLMCTFVDHSLSLDHALESIFQRTFCVWAMFSMGDLAQKSIRDDFFLAIYSRRWLQLSQKARYELDLFLDVIQMGKPCFEISGLYVIDRMRLLSIIQSIGTFLVVMMQLEVSTDLSS